MKRVSLIQSDEAPGEAKELLQKYESEHGKRPVLWEVMANHPPLLTTHADFYQNTIQTGNLDQELKEMVGVAVSGANECEFCTSSHRVNLVQLFGYEGEKAEAIANGNFENLTERERVVLEFARTVADDPQFVIDDDIESLRDVGFTDANIVELLGAIAQFVAANIYADSLGLDPSTLEDYK